MPTPLEVIRAGEEDFKDRFRGCDQCDYDDIYREMTFDYWHKQTLEYFKKVYRIKGKPEDILQKCMEILRPEDVRSKFEAFALILTPLTPK